MEKDHYRLIYQQEENHWWYKGMWVITESLLDQYYKDNNLNILDAGCGTGINLTKLSKFGKTFGVDFSEEALKYSKERNHKRICNSSIEFLPFKNASFDLVTSFEVLYHSGVKDDERAIKQFYAACKKNGRVLIRVPAFKILFGKHDLVVHGIRRYRKNELKDILTRAGFEIEKISYLDFFLFFPALVIRLIQRISKSEKESDIKPTNNLLNNILYYILKFESYYLRKFNFPFGISLLCIARKTD
ncbi:MAG: class I SAM-dependent methyltransferase [Candidatus Schekmanbacteria bacterium]|nr:class I SAM-dependent methyltransferase [Candidatus Schekmanbacteria bacterium]